MESFQLYYFAYGSNMDEDRMKKRDVEFFAKLRGILRGWELAFNKVNDSKDGAGFTNIMKKDSGIVEGIIYKTNEESIKKLDGREGYPDHYGKKEMSVELQNGEFLNCVVYIANPAKVRKGLMPEKWYLSHLLKGKEFLSEKYFTRLKNTPTLD